jgi:hypothetical protein
MLGRNNNSWHKKIAVSINKLGVLLKKKDVKCLGYAIKNAERIIRGLTERTSLQ